MPRGGTRPGGGGNGGLRTTQSVVATPGGQYGDAKAQTDALSAMPLENTAGVLAQGGQPTAPPPPVPGAIGGLMDPSARQAEPVTHGAASGPGAGLEAIQPPGLPMTNMSSMLTSIAQSSGSADLAALANHARSLGQ